MNPFLDSISTALDSAKSKVREFLARLDLASTPGTIPEKEDEKSVASFVKEIYDEAVDYYETEFRQTKGFRFGYAHPSEWAKAVLQLEAGDHFAVFGTRRKDSGQKWKQEVPDNEIQRQIRFKTAYNSANWHEIVVTPNVAGLDDILDQERDATNWGQNVQAWVKYCSIYGHADIHSILNMENEFYPDGIVQEILCQPNTVFYSPYAKSKHREDGCWYIVWADMVSDKWVKKNTSLDPATITPAGAEEVRKFRLSNEGTKTYNHTKMFRAVHAYVDDDTIENIPVEEWPHSPKETQLEYAILLENGDIQAKEDENHVKHIEEHELQLRAIQEDVQRAIQEGVPEEDVTAELSPIIEKLTANIKEHTDFLSKPGIEEKYQRPKYPFGRYILYVGDRIAEDVPNPHEIPYRMLFHRLYYEKVPNRIDGRSAVEVMWQDQKALDIHLSRIADMTVLGKPKYWFHRTEKKFQDKEFDNNPEKPGFYEVRPPEVRQIRANPDDYQLADNYKQNMREAQGVNKVTYGENPGSHSSAKNTALLIQQNAMVVTGELNTNLSDVIRDVVQTRIELWKKHYVRPRVWNINGQPQVLSLSRALRFRVVVDPVTGQEQEMEIGQFIVDVKPQSNFPFKWETEMQLLMEAYNLRGADGLPLINPEAIKDKIQERYPRYALYRKMDKALEIGMQVMMQEQAAQEKQQHLMERAESRLQSKALNTMVKGEVLQDPSQLTNEPQEE